MQLKQLIQDIAEYTVKNEIVECAMGGLSLYEINFKENNNYPLLFISPSTNHTISNNTITYQIVIYYIDRLLRDNDNNIDIVNASVGKLQQIINIIRNFDNVLKLNSDYQITNFADTQRLTDCVAGGSVTLSITVQNTQGVCAVDAVLPTIKVVLQNKNVEITENGEYNITFDNGYTGLKEVKVGVNIDTESFYQEGYEEGFSKGETEGYNEGYTEGDANGRAEQKNLLESIKITENGMYVNENGFDEITVDVDTSGAYNEGFDEGKTEGIEQGKEEQKALLESITIKENGMYVNENGFDEVIVDVPTGGGDAGDYEEGYNKGYEEGVANAEEEIAETAQVLHITENGRYTTKYTDVSDSDAVVTGYFDDGTPFYNYAIVNNVVFGTGIQVSPETEVEVWFKTTQYINNEGIVASQNSENINSIFKLVEGEGYFTGEIGGMQPNIFDMEGAKLELNKWYHLKMSYINGLWVNGKQVGDYQESDNVVAPYFELFINGYSNQDWYGCTGLNNYFGMVKINGKTFIPKEDSFWNITEDYALNSDVMGDNAYYEFKNPLGNLIKEVIVDVDTSDAYNEGFNNGIEQGKEEQKSLLESITIKENGVFFNENGYNEVIVDIPTGGSDAVVKGYFEDGTPFYNYGFCNQIGYNTGIKVTPTTKLEVWYMSRNWGGEIDTAIVATQYYENYDAIFKITKDYVNVKAEIAQENISAPFTMNNGEWYHFKLSYEEGFWVNDEFIGYISNNVTEPTFELCINSFTSDVIAFSSSNAYYGMIKIDNQIIIPTEQGFYNVTTDSYLDAITDESSEYTYTEVNVDVPTGGYEEGYNKGYEEGYMDGETSGYETGYSEGFGWGKEEQKSLLEPITITENGTYTNENGYSEITVEVPTSGGDSSVLKIPNGMKLGQSSVIPSNLDTSEVIDMSNMFSNCKVSSIPFIDTSKATGMQYTFSYCDKITTIPLIDTSNATDINRMFSNCTSLTEIPQLDTSKVSNMREMFYNCTSLVSIPSLYCGNITSKNYYPLYNGSTKVYEHLTDVGGFIDMKYSWDNDYGLPKCPNLSYQSCINILNGLYDFTGNGETPNSNQGQLKVHQNFLDLVGDEILIGTNKGWNIFA